MPGFLKQTVESYTLPKIDFTLHDVMPEECYAPGRERFTTSKDISVTSDKALQKALKITNPIITHLVHMDHLIPNNVIFFLVIKSHLQFCFSQSKLTTW